MTRVFPLEIMASRNLYQVTFSLFSFPYELVTEGRECGGLAVQGLIKKRNLTNQIPYKIHVVMEWRRYVKICSLLS